MDFSIGENLPIVLIVLVVALSPVVKTVLPPPYGDDVGFIILLSPIAIIIVQSFAIELHFKNFSPVLDSVIPTAVDGKKKWFCDGYESTKLQDLSNGQVLYETTVHVRPTKFQTTVQDYGKIPWFYCQHIGLWESRISPQPRQVYVWGTWFKHPRVDFPEFWEQDERRVIDGQPIPVLWLARAGGDYARDTSQYLLEQIVPTNGQTQTTTTDLATTGTTAITKGMEPSVGYQVTQQQRINSVSADNSRLTAENISLKMTVQKQSDEIDGLLKGGENITDGSRKLALDAFSRASSIEDAVERLGGAAKTNWIPIITVVALSIIALSILWNPKLQTELGTYLSDRQNQVFIGIIAAIGVVGLYYYFKVRRK